MCIIMDVYGVRLGDRKEDPVVVGTYMHTCGIIITCVSDTAYSKCNEIDELRRKPYEINFHHIRTHLRFIRESLWPTRVSSRWAAASYIELCTRREIVRLGKAIGFRGMCDRLYGPCYRNHKLSTSLPRVL